MRKVLFILSMVFTVLVGSTPAFASVSDNQVTSQKVKEADGTSGQNTNSGSGVKTGHIQNGAVTSGKVADGAVSSTKILDSAVSSSKIQDGAVTDAKIAGPISGSKISSAGLNADTVDGQHASAFAAASHTQAMSTVTGLEAALAGKSDVTHNHDTLYQQKYGKVAVVAQTGGDYADPVTAMNDIATWCGIPSATNPCLLKMMPGVYALGNTLMMKSYVDLEGSGTSMTKIAGTVRYEYTANNELRMLTVEGAVNTVEMYGSSQLQIRDASLVALDRALDMAYSGNVTLKHVDMSAPGTGIFSYYPYGDVTIEGSAISAGVGFFGYSNSGEGNLYIKNSKIIGSGGVVYAGAYDLFVTGSDLLGEEGSINDAIFCGGHASRVIARDSTIRATRSLFLDASCASISLANTMISGTPVAGTKCFGVYDANYNPVTCQ